MSRYKLLLVLLVGAAQATVSCSDPAVDAADRETAVPLEDAPLAPSARELLDLAFDSASAMPLQPHIKNRSRAQGEVVAACFELDQPARALGYANRIANWQRGMAYADYAFYCAERGAAAEARRIAERAKEVAETSKDASEEEPGGQQWRADRIRARVAGALVLLGAAEEAAPLRAGMLETEVGKVALVEASLANKGEVSTHVERLDQFLDGGSFEQIRDWLYALVRLFDRFYTDAELRAELVRAIEKGSDVVPIVLRLELQQAMIESALSHDDPPGALALVEEAQSLMDGARWQPLDRIPHAARLAELRFLAGDAQRARRDVDALLGFFYEERDGMENYQRAGGLRPVAEAYQVLGDAVEAAKVYERAVEEGTENPNARARSVDLVGTCLSMALHGFEPSPELLARMREIRAGLVDPW